MHGVLVQSYKIRIEFYFLTPLVPAFCSCLKPAEVRKNRKEALDKNRHQAMPMSVVYSLCPSFLPCFIKE